MLGFYANGITLPFLCRSRLSSRRNYHITFYRFAFYLMHNLLKDKYNSQKLQIVSA